MANSDTAHGLRCWIAFVVNMLFLIAFNWTRKWPGVPHRATLHIFCRIIFQRPADYATVESRFYVAIFYEEIHITLMKTKGRQQCISNDSIEPNLYFYS